MATIFILVHDEVWFLKKCFTHLSDESGIKDHQIVIIDNASETGQMEEYLDVQRRKGTWVKRLPKNYNFSKAHNLVIQKLIKDNGLYGDIILMNSDIFCTGDTIKSLIASKKRHPKAGVIGAKLLCVDGSIDHAGVVFNQAKHPVSRLYKAHYNHRRANTEEPLQAVTFALAYITEGCWERLEGLQEPAGDAFGYFYEDIDFCLRAREAGFEVWYCPNAVAHHFGSATSREIVRTLSPEDAQEFLFGGLPKFVEKWGDKIIVDKEEKENAS